MRRAAITYSLQPQRPSRKGWLDCMDHEASRFAIYSHTARGKYRVTRFVQAFPTKAVALGLQQELTRLAKPLPRPTLGRRCVAAGRKIIARSLSYDQYHQQQGD
jgi:hypothetical protein